MEVNVAKTEIVVFGKKQFGRVEDLQGRWRYAGQAVPVKDEFKYLGVILHCTGGVSAAVPALAAAGKRAMWAMLHRISKLDVQSLQQKVSLFNTLVSPILGYCSEVWGPSLMSKAIRSGSMLNDVMQGVQFMFLRSVAGGVRKSTPRMLLLREFAGKPLVRRWLQAAVDSWNRAIQGGEQSLLFQCMSDNWSLRSDMSGSVKLWCTDFVKVLQH